MWAGLHDNAAHLREGQEAWLAASPGARARYRADMLNVAAFACKTTGDIETGLDYCAACGGPAAGRQRAVWRFPGARSSRALLLLKRGDYRAALEVAEIGLGVTSGDKLHGHPEHFGYQQAVRAAVLYEFDDIAGAPARHSRPSRTPWTSAVSRTSSC